MVQINFAQKEIQCKIVYYGPGMSGKTTNLELVHGKVPDDNRGELTSIATTGERTLYFDYMPLDLGQIAGIQTKFQLYTVPGQIYYKSTRRLVLQGVDGIVFVADSSKAKMRENHESFEDLEANLKEMGRTIHDIPIVMQWNKRDLPDAMSVEELEKELNPHNFPSVEAVANKGDGVFPTLKLLSQKVLESVNKGGLSAAKAKSKPKPVRAKAAAAAPQPVGSVSSAGMGAPSVPTAVTNRTPPAPQATAASQPHAARASTAPRAGFQAPPPASQPYGVGGTEAASRNLQDRVVRVSGLKGNKGGKGKLVALLGLGLLMAAAAYFAVTQM